MLGDKRGAIAFLTSGFTKQFSIPQITDKKPPPPTDKLSTIPKLRLIEIKGGKVDNSYWLGWAGLLR